MITHAIAPFVVAEGRDVVIHESIEDAERSLEAADIIDDVYRAFDAVGRRLVLRAVSRRPDRRGPEVEIELAADGQTHENELRELLLDYLSSCAIGSVEMSIGDVSHARFPI